MFTYLILIIYIAEKQIFIFFDTQRNVISLIS